MSEPDEQRRSGAPQKKNVALLSVFVLLAIFMIVSTHYGTKTLSAVRAGISAEGEWAKAQKEGAHLLMLYAIYGDSVYYRDFRQRLELHRGFEMARKVLVQDDPQYAQALEGFGSARIHPDDAEKLVWLTANFHEYSRFERAIYFWSEGDKYIGKLDSLGAVIHANQQDGPLERPAQLEYLSKISAIDQHLTRLESDFSASMADAARWVRSVIFWLIVGFSIVLVVVGYLFTSSFFREINMLNYELTKNEAKYRKVLEYSRDLIYELNVETGRYEYVNPHIREMLGYEPEQLIQQGKSFVLSRVHPDDLERMQREVLQMEGRDISEKFVRETEFRIRDSQGEYVWVNNQRSLVRDEKGKPVAIVGSVRDISERRRKQEQTERSLAQKKMLLEEIHHRVKNNLAVISSILELQKQDAGSAKPILADTQARIHSIATIHEKLYQTETLSSIDVQEYIRDFSQVIFQTYDSHRRNITIEHDLEPIQIDIKRAVPLGLIFNELLNNAFKHGFEGRDEGTIRVTLKVEGNEGVLQVANNGEGLPEDFSMEEGQSLGLTLIRTLSEQLEGTLQATGNGWTAFTVRFPLNSSARAGESFG